MVVHQERCHRFSFSTLQNMQKALTSRLPKAHKGHKNYIPSVLLRPNPKMTTKVLGTYWTLQVTVSKTNPRKNSNITKTAELRKAKKQWSDLLYILLSHVERDRITECQKGTCKGILSNACTVSSVTVHSHPQKKPGQGKNSSQILCQNNSSVPREKGTYSRSYRERKKPEIWNAARPYPSRLIRGSVREGHWASERSDGLSQELP